MFVALKIQPQNAPFSENRCITTNFSTPSLIPYLYLWSIKFTKVLQMPLLKWREWCLLALPAGGLLFLFFCFLFLCPWVFMFGVCWMLLICANSLARLPVFWCFPESVPHCCHFHYLHSQTPYQYHLDSSFLFTGFSLHLFNTFCTKVHFPCNISSSPPAASDSRLTWVNKPGLYPLIFCLQSCLLLHSFSSLPLLTVMCAPKRNKCTLFCKALGAHFDGRERRYKNHIIIIINVQLCMEVDSWMVMAMAFKPEGIHISPVDVLVMCRISPVNWKNTHQSS